MIRIELRVRHDLPPIHKDGKMYVDAYPDDTWIRVGEEIEEDGAEKHYIFISERPTPPSNMNLIESFFMCNMRGCTWTHPLDCSLASTLGLFANHNRRVHACSLEAHVRYGHWGTPRETLQPPIRKRRPGHYGRKNGARKRT